jgi:hypothetical protein
VRGPRPRMSGAATSLRSDSARSAVSLFHRADAGYGDTFGSKSDDCFAITLPVLDGSVTSTVTCFT